MHERRVMRLHRPRFGALHAESRWDARLDPRAVRLARPLAAAFSRRHPVRIEGLEHLPKGGALLVGNHGLLGYDTLVFFERILAMTGRALVGCADRWFFRVPLLRDVLVRVGGMYGCRDNAVRALERGSWVVAYPGGAREVLKRREDAKYKLQWHESRGFLHVAAAAGVPIVPFAAAGVDDTFDVIGTVRGSGSLLMGHSKYDLPVVWGAGPLPRAVPLWYRLGAPLDVRALERDHGGIDGAHGFVHARVQSMVDALVSEWREAHAPNGERRVAETRRDVVPLASRGDGRGDDVLGRAASRRAA